MSRLVVRVKRKLAAVDAKICCRYALSYQVFFVITSRNLEVVIVFNGGRNRASDK